MAIRTANNQSLTEITAFPSGVALGGMVLLATETADGSGTTVTFDSDIDSTYPIYLFKYISVHPQTDNKNFQVNFRDGSTAYDAIKTTTAFYVYHDEADSTPEFDDSVQYGSGNAQGTGVQILCNSVGADNDESVSGKLWLFNPSSTTFMKHFISRAQGVHKQPASFALHVAGYCNTTSAIDGIQFSFASGNIDSGTFKMYGIKDS